MVIVSVNVPPATTETGRGVIATLNPETSEFTLSIVVHCDVPVIDCLVVTVEPAAIVSEKGLL
jgi:hypothetical protein